MSRQQDGGDLNPTAEDYGTIEQAVMETERGRSFLAEHARRVRAAETAGLRAAIERLEAALAANRDAIATRLAQALDSPKPESPDDGLSPRQMKYFGADEDLFETPAPEPGKGARLTIRHSEASIEPAAVPEPQPVQAAFTPELEQAATDAAPKARIIIIRHKPGETIDVPLQADFARSA